MANNDESTVDLPDHDSNLSSNPNYNPNDVDTKIRLIKEYIVFQNNRIKECLASSNADQALESLRKFYNLVTTDNFAMDMMTPVNLRESYNDNNNNTDYTVNSNPKRRQTPNTLTPSSSNSTNGGGRRKTRRIRKKNHRSLRR